MQSERRPTDSIAADHWSDMTDRWAYVGLPLKPGPDDIAVYERFAARAAQNANGELRALLLGVTPEIAGCGWPPATHLTAMDFSYSMITRLWPPPRAPAISLAVCANWLAMPTTSRTIDFAIGDGCNAALSFPDDVSAMVREVARVLRPEGLFVLRAFVRPEPADTVDDIARDLASDRIESVHVLKWRLFAALCENVGSGARLGDVWKVWNGMRAVAAKNSHKPGWSPADISTIEVYRGDIHTRFYFPTLEQLRTLMSQHFSKQQYIYGQYELADRCPIILLSQSDW